MRRLGLLLAAFIACRSQPASETISVRGVAPAAPSTGAVALRLVADPGTPGVELAPDENYVPPQLLSSNPAPVYPPDLVPLHLKHHTVGLRITFNETGRVSDVGESPVAGSTGGQYQAAFTAAALQALEQWRCWPPEVRKFRPGPDGDGDGKPDFQIVVKRKVLRAYFDVSITFEVVDGLPTVKSDVPQ